MPDTGAPWNIPYVENADLVRDWPADSLLVANAVAAGLSAAGNAGIGSNVASVTKTDVFSTTSSSLTPVTGLTVSITPTTNTSKILVLVGVTGMTSDAAGSEDSGFVLLRGATEIARSSGGDSAWTMQLSQRSSPGAFSVNGGFAHLDSPATTSATTYSVSVAAGGGTLYINRSAVVDVRSVSTLTVIEVAV